MFQSTIPFYTTKPPVKWPRHPLLNFLQTFPTLSDEIRTVYYATALFEFWAGSRNITYRGNLILAASRAVESGIYDTYNVTLTLLIATLLMKCWTWSHGSLLSMCSV